MSERLDAIAESQYVNGQLPVWTDQLRPASFRDVPFHVDTIEWTAGDNVVLREYPFQDLPTVFRMGAAAQEIKFSAYVIGQDYHLQRDALMRALTGPGKLMHPTAGVLEVFVAGKFTVKEAPTSEGGMARFDLHFVVAEPRRYPVGTANTQRQASAQADVAQAAAADNFAAAWIVTDKPGWVAEQAVARVKDSLAGLTSRISTASSGLNDFNSSFNANYRAIVNGLNDLVRAPRQLADAVVQLVRLPQDLSQVAARDFAAAFAWAFDLKAQLPRKPFEVRVMPPVGAGLVMYGTGTPVAGVPDSTGQRQINALAAGGDAFLEVVATAAFVQAMAVAELSNYDEALALRAQLHQQCIRLMQAASEAEATRALPGTSVHDALLALHGAALADLQARGQDLVRLTTYTPESWQPVWYISHKLFGTARYADEIMAMNPHIQHPLLVPPGRPLRIVRHE